MAWKVHRVTGPSPSGHRCYIISEKFTSQLIEFEILLFCLLVFRTRPIAQGDKHNKGNEGNATFRNVHNLYVDIVCTGTKRFLLKLGALLVYTCLIPRSRRPPQPGGREPVAPLKVSLSHPIFPNPGSYL